jgi:hypothetical protein
MIIARLKAIGLISLLVLLFIKRSMAGAANTACVTSLVEDKPPCITVTKYVPDSGGSNVLKTTLVFVGKTTTNTSNEIVKEIDLPPGVVQSSSSFMAPAGIGMILLPGTNLDGMGPGILTSLQQSHLPNATISDTSPRIRPNVFIQGPAEGILTQPLIEIKGMSDQPLSGVSYDVVNGPQTLLHQRGYVTDEFYDEHLLRFTTNWFECLDVGLAPGTNEIFIHCNYLSGRRLTVKRSYILRLDLKTNAPTFQISWPTAARQISGEKVTIRGSVDDISAKVTGEITDNSQSKTIEGLVERNGRFWLEDVPLLAKTNHLKVTLTDVVGNASTTNLTLIKSEDRLVVNPVPLKQLWQMQVTVAGKVYPPNRAVWVNDRQATVQTNGQWMARGVPLAKDGVAVFDVLATPQSEQLPAMTITNFESNSEIKPAESVSIKTVYTPAGMILNATQPTYGSFKIQLTGTGGQNFILQDSTNLVDWAPVLTNLNSASQFDYYDTNFMAYGCRFFRILPIQ